MLPLLKGISGFKIFSRLVLRFDSKLERDISHSGEDDVCGWIQRLAWYKICLLLDLNSSRDGGMWKCCPRSIVKIILIMRDCGCLCFGVLRP